MLINWLLVKKSVLYFTVGLRVVTPTMFIERVPYRPLLRRPNLTPALITPFSKIALPPIWAGVKRATERKLIIRIWEGKIVRLCVKNCRESVPPNGYRV